MRPPLDIRAVVAKLDRALPVRKLTDPLQLILWDNVGYLIDDERREALFGEFERRVGLSAQQIGVAREATLLDIARRGGMRPEERVRRWRLIAEIVIQRADGDLTATLKMLPIAKARALIKLFPTFADPGADKVLLLSGIDVRPALDSNGLRVLLRLGVCEEGASYSASYKAAVAYLAAKGEPTRAWFANAYWSLRALGQTLCKRKDPLCRQCRFDKYCAHVALEGQY